MVSLNLVRRATCLSLGLAQFVLGDEYEDAYRQAITGGFSSISAEEAYAAIDREQSFHNFTTQNAKFLATNGATCSPKKPCTFGCCGPLTMKGEGICGPGPDFCGPGCTASCGWKSECDPGWGMKFAASSSCPLSACCSPHGFCGDTQAFCRGRRAVAPSCPGGQSAKKRTIGYYQGWNIRRLCGTMTPEQIPLGQYTHINFAFAYVDPVAYTVIHMDDEVASLYKRVVWLKDQSPDLQVWISIAGGAMSPWHTAFSDMASSKHTQEIFLDSLIDFLETYHFDGVDLNWEYPAAEDKGGKPIDFDSFVTLCRRLRERLDDSGNHYGLSITLPTSYKYLKGFNLRGLKKHIDWFNFMTYDFHGAWDTDPSLGQSALPHTNLTEVEMKMDILWKNDIDPRHVVMGLGFYGRSFTLKYPDCKEAGCPFRGVGRAGRCTAIPGVLSGNEIKEIIDKGASVTFDKKAAVKVVTWDNDQWVSYDDPQTLRMKLDYANSMCLGGTMTWAVNLDDHEGTLIKALG